MEEKWKNIPRTNGFYEVSNKGRVRSWNNRGNRKSGKLDNPKILNPAIGSGGYEGITLSDKNQDQIKIRVHQLVARAFIPNPENKPCINHIDSDRTNNNVNNLEWCTHKENARHCIENGRFHRGEKTGSSVLTASQVVEARRLYKEGGIQVLN